MHGYGMRDVERVLRLSGSTVRNLIRRGFIAPTRGKRREFRFSFQDLVVLRTAHALVQAKISPRRITHALTNLRRTLPHTAPLSGLQIRAAGSDVVVKERSSQWEADSGQYLLALDVEISDGVLKISEPPNRGNAAPSPPANDVEGWFEHALQIEDANPVEALSGYERCLNADPSHLEARINRARLLHVAGRLDEAIACYQQAPDSADPTLLFNWAIVLEDLGRPGEAISKYQEVLALDPDYADAHHNIARLYHLRNDAQDAIRHLAHYRRLASITR